MPPPPFFSKIVNKTYHFSCFMPHFSTTFPNSFMGDNLFIHVCDLNTTVYFFFNSRWILLILGCELDITLYLLANCGWMLFIPRCAHGIIVLFFFLQLWMSVVYCWMCSRLNCLFSAKLWMIVVFLRCYLDITAYFFFVILDGCYFSLIVLWRSSTVPRIPQAACKSHQQPSGTYCAST